MDQNTPKTHNDPQLDEDARERRIALDWQSAWQLQSTAACGELRDADEALGVVLVRRVA